MSGRLRIRSPWQALALVALLVLGACSRYGLISTERVEIIGAYSVEPGIEWNYLIGQDIELWTVDGLHLQNLFFVSGIEDGDTLLAAKPEFDFFNESKIPEYKEDFSLLDIREWIEASYAQANAARMETHDFRPAGFGSKKGFRFEFSFANEDGLSQKGFVVGATIDAELHLIIFTAAALHYYDKFAPEAERIIRSIRIDGDDKAA
jgi:hypothetical protein